MRYLETGTYGAPSDLVKCIKGKAIKVLNSKPPTSFKHDWSLTAEHSEIEI